MSLMYSDWRFVESWVRLPNWARITCGVIVICAALGCFRLSVPGVLLMTIGLLMLIHGIFGSPESGPPP